jgi:DNA-directed RNA polymerase subunit beta'
METTIGNILVNEKLPQDLRDYQRVLDGKAQGKLIRQIGEKHPKDYGKIVKDIKDLGDKYSTLEGSSFSYEDWEPVDTTGIHKKYQADFDKVDKMTNQQAKDDARRELNLKVENEINAQVKKDIATKDNRFLLWGRSGAKGGDSNFRQMLYASGNQVDVKEELFPHMSKKSLAEGLAPSDFFITSVGARKGVVGSFLSVRDPGAFGKELFATTNDLVITDSDCGTKKGKTYPIQSREALDRYLLNDTKNYKRNDPITHMMMDDLEKQGIKEFQVRSPLYCISHDGICAKCSGLQEDGKDAVVGDPIGIRSAQSLTEPLTQMALSVKHSGGVVQKKPAFQHIQQILHAPENFPDGAVLARKDGTVDSIGKTPDGGTNIVISDTTHYASPNRKLYVKQGEKVTAGDALTDGLVNPKELVSLKGMDEGREYLAKILRNTYAENGHDGHPKVFETVTRAIMNHATVADPGDHPHLYKDQVVRWNQSRPLTEKQIVTKAPLDALGFRLARDIVGLKAGTKITAENFPKLSRLKSIEVYKNPAVLAPMMISTERAALHKDDFISAMGYRNIKQVLQSAVSEMEQASVHSYNPITAYVHAKEFGKGEKGKF